MKKRGLSPRQARFVAEYLVSLNATKAAENAGFSARTARQQGQRLLSNVAIAEAIQDAKVKREIRTGITADRVLRETELMAFSDITAFELVDGKLKTRDGVPEEAVRAIKSLKLRTITDGEGRVTHEAEFALWDKPGMVKIAGRHTGTKGFADKLEVSGPDGAPLAGPSIVLYVPDNSRGPGSQRPATDLPEDPDGSPGPAGTSGV